MVHSIRPRAVNLNPCRRVRDLQRPLHTRPGCVAFFIDILLRSSYMCVVALNASGMPSNDILTDGCGFINGGALAIINRMLPKEERVVAIQGRVMGSKGLWLLHPDEKHHNRADVPRIWIRDSQVKIQLPKNPHRCHTIFDLVAAPHVSTPCHLSRLTIINLVHNGVPSKLLIKLMADVLNREFAALTNWGKSSETSPDLMVRLWRRIDHLGHVLSTRTQHLATIELGRVCGLSRRLVNQDSGRSQDEETDSVQFNSQTASQTTRSPSPPSVFSDVLKMLQAGFTPLTQRLLYDKLKTIFTRTVESIIKDFRLEVSSSAEAFIVPGTPMSWY